MTNTIDEIQLDMKSFIDNAEVCKAATLRTLVAEGYITLEQAKEFSSNYGIVTVKQSWYQNIFKGSSKGWMFRCVKLS